MRHTKWATTIPSKTDIGNQHAMVRCVHKGWKECYSIPFYEGIYNKSM